MTRAQKQKVKLRLAKHVADSLADDTEFLREGLDPSSEFEVRHHGGQGFLHILCRDDQQSGPTWFEISIKERF